MRCLPLVVLVVAACGRTDLDVPRRGAGGALTLDAATLATNTNDATFTGTCRVGIGITVSPSGQATCVNGRFTFTVSATEDGIRDYVFSQQPSHADGRWTRDTTGPTILAESRLASGATVTRSRFPALHVRAADALSDVQALCARVDDVAAPAASDPCWLGLGGGILGLPPAGDVAVDTLPAELGFISGDYRAHLWARDALGNVGEHATLGIEYRPVAPPTLRDVFGTASPLTGATPQPGQLSVSEGNPLYVSWYAASESPLAASPIRVYTTTDDATYAQVGVDLANGVNGDCALPPGATGCWNTSSPTSSAFGVRVIVADAEGYASAETSPAINAAPLSVIAGSVDSGVDASATAAMLFAFTADGASTASQATVIRRDGTLYYRDLDRGILAVDPRDGVLRVFIAAGPAIIDGPVAEARVMNPVRLTIDANEDLILLDEDRIRKIDLQAQPPTITTIVGGGARTDDGAPGTEFFLARSQIATYGSENLAVLPNGDIWFQNEKFGWPAIDGGRLRIYDAASRTVRSIAISGTGDTFDATTNLAACSVASFHVGYDTQTSAVTTLAVMFDHNITQPQCTAPGHDFTVVAIDPTTGAKLYDIESPFGWGGDYRAITARDGKVYMVARTNGVLRLDTATRDWQQLLGQGGSGDCDDGMAAAACAIDLNDAYVDHSGHLYFQSRNRVRVVGNDGLVHTIAGQPVSVGDGGRPASARFGRIDVVQPFGNDLMVLDVGNGTFRRIGAQVTRFAGNGLGEIPDNTRPANAQGLGYNNYGRLWTSFGVGPGPTLYYSQGNGYISRISQPTDPWTVVIGNDASPTVYNDSAANGTPGTQINLLYPSHENHPPRIFGIANDILLTQRDPVRYIDTKKVNVYFTGYRMLDQFRQTALAGVDGDASDYWCAIGTPLASCNTPSADATFITQAAWSSATNAWLMAFVGDYSIRSLPAAPGGAMGQLVGTTNAIASLAYRGGATGTVYYCGVDGRIYQLDTNPRVETKLPWTIESAVCVGLGMVYETATQSLVFPYRANHMYGLMRMAVP